jgi:hypothetical protein
MELDANVVRSESEEVVATIPPLPPLAETLLSACTEGSDFSDGKLNLSLEALFTNGLTLE